MTSLTTALILTVASRADDGFFWHISDIHVSFHGGSIPTGQPFGSHGSPSQFANKLYQNMTAEMAAKNPSPDFILLSGDISFDVKDIAEASRILKASFPNTPCYVSNGNHDTNLGFYNRANASDNWSESKLRTTDSKLHDSDPDLGLSSERLELLDAEWTNGTSWLKSPWCVNCEQSFRVAGTYSTPAYGVPGLRIINLNTNPWSQLKGPVDEGPDPAKMYEYLEAELQKARAAGDKAYLMGHIPPGYYERAPEFDWTEEANNKVEGILADYKDVVKGFFHGHDHSDAIRLHKSNLVGEGEPTVVSYLTPAGAPLNQNPGFRSYSFDKSSLDILDYDQYYLNLDKANAAGVMQWELEYSAKSYLDLDDLTPTSWNKLHKRFLDDDSAFQKFAQINYVQYDMSNCSGSCKATMVCGLFAVTTPRHAACLASFGYASVEAVQLARAAEDAASRARGEFVPETHMPGVD